MLFRTSHYSYFYVHFLPIDTLCCFGISLFFDISINKWLWWSRGSVLAFNTQVHGLKPGQSRQIFKGEKIRSTPSFGGEVKPSVPCRRFGACKRSLMAWIETSCRQNYWTFLTHSSTFWSLTSLRMWRHLAAKVGMSKRGGKQWQTTPKNLPRI